MKTLVKQAALELIRRNQSTTTLEVKDELILTQPTYFWKQSFVSAAMAELADDGELTYIDNGTFRTYYGINSNLSVAPSVNVSARTYKKIPLAQRSYVKASQTQLAKLVQENAGKFITLTHNKRTTNTPNTMNCQVLKDLTPLGAIQVKEQGQLKTIYPTDLLEVRVKNTVYQLK